MLDDDQDGLGQIGSMSPEFGAHYFMWKIVKEFGISMEEFSRMTFNEICEATAYLELTNDYSRAWNAYYELKNAR